MAPIARSALLARAFRARAGTARQSFNRLSRRSYASGHGHGEKKSAIQGDLPWIIGAASVTGGGVYVLWPEPPKYGKGNAHAKHDDHHEEKEDDASDEGSQEEQQDEGKSDESKEDNSSKSEDSEKESKSADDQEEDSDEKQGAELGTKENPITDDDRDDGNRKVKYADAKGGNKVHLESKNAVKQGNKGDDPKGGSANVHSGSGENVYNTDTKHSTDAQSHPETSNKAEGDVETAKLKTPVDPSRPAK